MIEKKYLIMIGVIICLLLLYYFFDEIRNLKKSLLPTYQKTMALEAKVSLLEKKVIPPISDKRGSKRNDSPVFSISYQSDMIKNPNQSLRYDGISESEASKIKTSILGPKPNSNPNKCSIPNNNKCLLPNPKINPVPSPKFNPVPSPKPNSVPNSNPISKIEKVYRVELDELSDFKEMSNSDKLYGKSDTINVKVTDFMSNRVVSEHSNDEFSEYEKILKGFKSTISSENVFSNDELDKKILRDISESIKYEDQLSENTLSNISTNTSPIKNLLNRSRTKNQK